jgi:hypothetical protein
LELSGFDEAVGEAKALTLSEEVLVVLDRGNKRLVVFDRGGGYQKQLLWQGLEMVSDMTIWNNKLLMLSGKNLYELDLSS